MAIVRYTVNIGWTGSGGPGANVWHLSVPGAVEGPDHPGVASAVDAIHTFYAAIAGNMKASLSGPAEAVANVEQPGGGTFVTVPSWSELGAGSADPLPQLLALTCTWRTANATKRGRGRTFLGPFSETDNDTGGTPSSSLLTTVRNAASALVAASAASADWDLVVYSRVDNTGYQVTQSRVRDVWSYLSSRR
jgi:hypothetical protein